MTTHSETSENGSSTSTSLTFRAIKFEVIQGPIIYTPVSLVVSKESTKIHPGAILTTSPLRLSPVIQNRDEIALDRWYTVTHSQVVEMTEAWHKLTRLRSNPLPKPLQQAPLKLNSEALLPTSYEWNKSILLSSIHWSPKFPQSVGVRQHVKKMHGSSNLWNSCFVFFPSDTYVAPYLASYAIFGLVTCRALKAEFLSRVQS